MLIAVSLRRRAKPHAQIVDPFVAAIIHRIPHFKFALANLPKLALDLHEDFATMNKAKVSSLFIV